MNLFAETLLQFVLGVVWWVVLFPVLWVAAAPIILVMAAFQQQHCSAAISRFDLVLDRPRNAVHAITDSSRLVSRLDTWPLPSFSVRSDSARPRRQPFLRWHGLICLQPLPRSALGRRLVRPSGPKIEPQGGNRISSPRTHARRR
jgi:hypothetical protein